MEREERYVVLKIKDIEHFLSTSQKDDLHDIRGTIDAYRRMTKKGELKAVVVESDWPEYERVWKMLEARVNMENQHDAVRNDVNTIKLNEGVLVFARLLTQAVIQDEHEEGYDLSAGLFGPHLSQLMVQVNEWRKKAELFDMIRNLMGYIENGTDTSVTLFQDDATRWFTVAIGRSHERKGESAPSLEAAIRKMYDKYGDKE
ncbi:hypothetical protein [Raoultella planticola]|uniref:hypothetical protein n=1 Tax=Raoultella planticola TaxID=575 RepID=UPI00384EDB46